MMNLKFLEQIMVIVVPVFYVYYFFKILLTYQIQVFKLKLGDSRAVLYRETPKEKLAIELSYDHKPTRPDEKERIIR